jgi:membrane-bound metal-dependent hydrolase YbcI (DUF457 family)
MEIDNYMVDLYILFWVIAFVLHGIYKKAPLYFNAWAGSMIIICIILFLDSFINKGYCLFSSCQPTQFIKLFININFDKNIINLLRALRITLTFLVIMKMHKYIEKTRDKDIKI